ncbi:SH3 domain-containing protein [Hymenobacter chitinivorans]|nr:SH3 domain-containing protein [Hymenobacter chitinivorans]
MKAILLVILSSTLLFGCATSKPPVVTQTVRDESVDDVVINLFTTPSADGADLRSSPDESASVVTHFSPTRQIMVKRTRRKQWAIIDYNGVEGYILLSQLAPFTAPSTPYSSGSSSGGSSSPSRNIQTGPRGGQYYINKNGNKTYIKH